MSDVEQDKRVELDKVEDEDLSKHSTADEDAVDEVENYPSKTEEFLAKKIAPELMSHQGRITLLAIYFVLVIGAVWGASNISINFSIDFFIP